MTNPASASLNALEMAPSTYNQGGTSTSAEMWGSMGDSQSQKAREGSTLIQAGGNVTIGLSYADVKLMIAEEREKIIQQVWERAQEMLREAGIEAGPVPMKALAQLLQYASLEEDISLQDQWAALLANASTTPSENGRTPSFIEILRQLSPREAKLLCAVYDSVSESDGAFVRNHGDLWAASDSKGLNLGHLNRMYGQDTTVVDAAHFQSAVDNLLRLELLAEKHLDGKGRAQFWSPTSIGPFTLYGITVLGLQFVRACRPPALSKST